MIEAILNRLRGTKKKFVGFLNGNIIYALYIGLVIGLTYYFKEENINALYVGLVAMTLYILGESSGWSKWVGSLCHPENVTPAVRSQTKSGVFFAIHSIANFVIPQNTFYFWYCRLALTLRGLYWWMPLYLFFAIAGLISYAEALAISLLLGIGFPIACEIGRRWNFSYEWKFFHTSQGWCNQELIYGAFQGIALWYVVIQNGG